jgi:gliding motility-associated lipoprotein GldD
MSCCETLKSWQHVIKADDILEQPYLNPAKKVYGMFYQVDGNAATNSQFYATDSTKHFVTGSVYFKAQFWLYYARGQLY